MRGREAQAWNMAAAWFEGERGLVIGGVYIERDGPLVRAGLGVGLLYSRGERVCCIRAGWCW